MNLVVLAKETNYFGGSMSKKLSLVIVFVLLAGLISACGVQPAGESPVRQINVAGQGEVYLIPDIAYIYIGTRSESTDVSVALNENNSQAKTIASVLSEMGVDAKDIQTTAFNVYPYQPYDMEGQPMEMKFVVENTVYVKVRDLERLGEMLDSVVRSGANQINGIQFDVEDREQAEADARRLAVIDAKNKAAELAEAADVTLGDLMNISVYSSSNPVALYEAKGGGYAAMDSSVSVSSGQMVITADASLTYEIR